MKPCRIFNREIKTDQLYAEYNRTTLLKENTYYQFSLPRSRRDPLKHFETSELRHIRFAELRKMQIEQPNFTNKYVICLLKLKTFTENIVDKGSNFSSCPQYFVT